MPMPKKILPDILATSFAVLIFLPSFLCKSSSIDEISNKKDLEKLLRTRNNVLILFKQSAKEVPGSLIQNLEKTADQLKGIASIIQVDCSSPDGRKICKKEKVEDGSYVLKHYFKGEFNKNYDRPETAKALLSFLKDPTAEAPWEEDPTSQDVVHLDDSHALKKFLTTEKKASLLMFYAPWCGHCQRMKPEYSSAATELKNEAVLAAMDVNKPQNNNIREAFNITGFPTLYYFKEGKFYFPYSGPRTKSEIVRWIRNPQPPNAETQTSEGVDAVPETVRDEF